MAGIKNIKIKRLQKRNTLNVKYQASLEEEIKAKEKIIKLQEKIISLQEDNDLYQKYIIEELQEDIVKVKNKMKKEKEKK